MSPLFCDTPMNYTSVFRKKVRYTPVRDELVNCI